MSHFASKQDTANQVAAQAANPDKMPKGRQVNEFLGDVGNALNPAKQGPGMAGFVSSRNTKTMAGGTPDMSMHDLADVLHPPGK